MSNDSDSKQDNTDKDSQSKGGYIPPEDKFIDIPVKKSNDKPPLPFKPVEKKEN
jgi:hypothetical protein